MEGGEGGRGEGGGGGGGGLVEGVNHLHKSIQRQ